MSNEHTEAALTVQERRENILLPIITQVIQVLRWGFRATAALMLVGVAIIIATSEQIATAVDPLEEIPGEIAAFNGSGFVDLGILVLLLTPVFAVATVAIGFHRIGDRRYALYASIVLMVLGLSIAAALLR